MKTKHTPGPWVAQNWVSSDESGDYPESIRAAGWPYGKSIAKIKFDLTGPFGDRREYVSGEIAANAKLIAAAPDLLEACKAILRGNSFEGYKEGIDKAKAAIKKATE